MSLHRAAAILATVVALIPGRVSAAGRDDRAGFWAGLGPGYGSLYRISDQEKSVQTDCFTLAFKIGYAPVSYLRLGFELGGWLIEGSSLNDPSKGEGVGQYNLFVQYYPFATNVYFRAGGGRASYWNNHPLGYGSSGWAATFGVGYDLSLAKVASLTPELHYSGGALDDVENAFTSSTGRRYHAWTASLGLTYR